MRLRKTALGALVSLGLLLGLAGLYFREPPAPPSSIEFTSAYQNEKASQTRMGSSGGAPVRAAGLSVPIESECLWPDQHRRYFAL